MAPRAAVLALIAMSLVLAFGLAPAAGQPVFGAVTGPRALAPGASAQYNVSIAGGPQGPSVTYAVQYYLTGADLTGGAPTQASPGTASGSQTLFRVNVTAPQRDQTVTLTAKISATDGTVTENGTAETTIQIITPILLSATFRNSGTSAALNVTVRFYVNGAFVGTSLLGRIGPGGEATATYSWLPVGLPTGSHSVRVEADLDGNGAIDPSRGEVVGTTIFYREAPPLSLGWVLGISAGVAVAAFFGTVAFRRRKRP